MIGNRSAQFRDRIWEKLQQTFAKLNPNESSIDINRLELIIPQILKEHSPQYEINYIIKNLFKLETDSNGMVTFKAFANFLVKRYCGQVALNKLHKKNQISNSKDKKINLNEFLLLLNQAYSFLDITVNQQIAEELFRAEDRDRDGYITYNQYFKFNQKYLCRDDQQILNEQRKQIGQKQILSSRLRRYLWSVPIEMCYVYDVDKNGLLDISQVTQFTKEILHLYSEQEIQFLLFNIFQLGSTNSIGFAPFMSFLIYETGLLGLTRFQQNCSNCCKRLNCLQFTQVFITSFYRFKNQKTVRKYMTLIFKKLDTDLDGYITFREYAKWIRQFISPQKLYSRQFLVDEDDEQNPKSIGFQEQKEIQLKITLPQNNIFKYSNFDLANRFKSNTLKQVMKFDINMDRHLDEGQISQILKVLLQENGNEIYYVTKNVFRYDSDGDKKITFDQFTNFLAQRHCGQIILQRLHKKNTYSRGRERIMNIGQFALTINTALSNLKVKATQQQIKTLFSQVDQDKNGWISYADYFLFLKTYFGSLSSQKSLNIPELSPADLNSNQGNPADRFSRLIRSQLRAIITNYDQDKNLRFDRDEIKKILQEVFNLSNSQIDYVLNKIFKLNINSNDNFSYDELLDLLLRIHVGQLMLRRLHDVQKFPRYAQCLLNFQDFSLVINNSISYLKLVPDKSLLSQVFSLIDTDSNGWISYKQYFDFINKYLGGNREDQIKPTLVKPAPPPPANSINLSQEEKLYRDIVNELNNLYIKYDANKDGQLSEAELESLIKDVLQETNKTQLNYIFRNLFKVDPSKDRKINFIQFATFMIQHSVELALQRFQIYQEPGKKTLTQSQFWTLVKSSFKFLKSLGTREQTINKIFMSLDVNKKQVISYTDLSNWVHLTLAKRVY